MASNPKILFFLAGAVATQAEIDAATAIGPGVQFRNAALIDPDAPLEECDGADGAVPPPYTDMTPTMADKDAVERRRAVRMGEIAPEDLTDEEKARLADPRITRGARPPTVNERIASGAAAGDLKSQTGEPRMTPPAEPVWGEQPAAETPPTSSPPPAA